MKFVEISLNNCDIFFFRRGNQQGTRQASNLIQSLIDDPDCDVAEILPPIPVNSLTPQKSLLSEPILDHQINSPLSKSLNTPKSSSGKVQRQISAPASIANTSKMLSEGSAYSDNISITVPLSTDSVFVETDESNTLTCVASKVKLKSSSITTTATTTTSTWKKTVEVLTSDLTTMTTSANLTKTISLTSSNFDAPITTTFAVRQSHVVTSTTVPQKIPTPSKTPINAGNVFRPLPKPIGSNRPFRVLSTPTNSLSSTTVSNSVAATLHSTLNSLLSQVATQRSPMIWNDIMGTKEQLASGDLIVTTVATSPNNTLSVTPIDRFLPASLSQSSSQESYKVCSRTPSLSPTSNHSNSPTPEEKPHLNPIGSERGHHKKPMSSNQLSGLQGLAPLLQGIDSVFGLIPSYNSCCIYINIFNTRNYRFSNKELTKYIGIEMFVKVQTRFLLFVKYVKHVYMKVCCVDSK